MLVRALVLLRSCLLVLLVGDLVMELETVVAAVVVAAPVAV